jgi:hypothetical protein
VGLKPEIDGAYTDINNADLLDEEDPETEVRAKQHQNVEAMYLQEAGD